MLKHWERLAPVLDLEALMAPADEITTSDVPQGGVRWRRVGVWDQLMNALKAAVWRSWQTRLAADGSRPRLRTLVELFVQRNSPLPQAI